jgi:hypothetical protein
LNSVAPSGAFAAGNGICATAIVAASIAPQNPSPVVHVVRSFVTYITDGVRRL